MTGTDDSALDSKAQYLGVGCITMFGGFFGGAMIMVLVAKIVGSVTRCEPPEGLPACDWYIYAGVGMIVGGLALPAIAISKLRASKRSKGPNDRS